MVEQPDYSSFAFSEFLYFLLAVPAVLIPGNGYCSYRLAKEQLLISTSNPLPSRRLCRVSRIRDPAYSRHHTSPEMTNLMSFLSISKYHLLRSDSGKWPVDSLVTSSSITQTGAAIQTNGVSSSSFHILKIEAFLCRICQL
jgi:hypothetical protein